MSLFHKAKRGQIVLGDSLEHMACLKGESVDLIVTSPPFGLCAKKGLWQRRKPRVCGVVQALRPGVQADLEAIRLACYRHRRSVDSRPTDAMREPSGRIEELGVLTRAM